MKERGFSYPKLSLLFFMIVVIILITGCNGVTPTGYTISATAGVGGSIDPSGTDTVNEGDNQTFTITPDEGYQIEDVLVDGASEGAVATYTFQNVQQDHTIQASFVGVKVYNNNTGIDYNTIQEAIDAALDFQTIIVYPGIYEENILFNCKDITVRSANPQDSAIVYATIIDGGENGSVVKFTGNDTSTLKGFTIQNGKAVRGGGIYVYKSSPSITGNTITGNTANVGGGINIDKISSPTITGNSISHNTADRGGGIVVDGYDSSPLITSNHIIFNTANSSGGIYVYIGAGDDPPVIGGINAADTANFNTICGNAPNQIGANFLTFIDTCKTNNYISSACAINIQL